MAWVVGMESQGGPRYSWVFPKEEHEEARRELASAMAKFASAELACSEAGPAPAALLDRRLRSAALESARRGLRSAYGKDDTAPRPCPRCGGRTRLSRREKAAGLLRELSELNFGAKRIERATGADLEAWRSAAEAAVGAAGGSLSSEASKPGRTLCCALDGTGVPALPRETAGRAGKAGANPSGSPRAVTREAKVGVPWVSETDGKGRPRLGEGTAVLFAGIESAAETPGEESPFERRLLRELAAAGCAPQDVDVCIGDGAEWIRRQFDDWFPDAVRVVDFHHAAEYLWAAARARHDAGDLAAAWAKKLCGMLKAGRIDDVLADLRRRGGDVEECRKAVGYLAERRDRMR